MIDRIDFDDGIVRYEMGSAPNHEQKHRHHHLICKKCGMVISFRKDLPEGPKERIADAVGFLVVDHKVKLCGYCIACGKDRCPKDAEIFLARIKYRNLEENLIEEKRE